MKTIFVLALCVILYASLCLRLICKSCDKNCQAMCQKQCAIVADHGANHLYSCHTNATTATATITYNLMHMQ